jgi:hypothetical protein
MAGERAEISRRRSAALWFGILAGPAAWALQVLIGYGAEEIACSAGSQTSELLGIGIHPWIVATHILLIAVTLVAGVVSSYCWRGTKPEATTGDRARWMALTGLMVSVLFLIVLAAGFFPSLFLSTCDPSL